VPDWLEKAITAHGGTIADVLDLEKLSSILSLDDVAFYLELNHQMQRWVPQAVCSSFKKVVSGVNYETLFSTGMGGDVVDLMMAHGLSMRNNTRHSSELFGPLAEPCSPAEISFACVHLTYDTIALRPAKVDKRENLHKGLEDDLLYQLNHRMTFEDVAKLPLFSHHLSHCMV
jgi:hypothetical protein